jgi:DNA-binding CsgD family transcriptional regulator
LRIREERRNPDAFAFCRLGFSTRQCEVMHWLRAGKRDREIAAILGCSSRTVAGYVATMLRKTGSNNRQAALHVVGQWLRTRGTNAGRK